MIAAIVILSCGVVAVVAHLLIAFERAERVNSLRDLHRLSLAERIDKLERVVAKYARDEWLDDDESMKTLRRRPGNSG